MATQLARELARDAGTPANSPVSHAHSGAHLPPDSYTGKIIRLYAFTRHSLLHLLHTFDIRLYNNSLEF